MKKKLKHSLLTAIVIAALAVPAFAQMPIPIGPGDGDSHTTPIGGMAVLAALGGGYAIKKLARRSLGEGGLRDGKREM